MFHVQCATQNRVLHPWICILWPYIWRIPVNWGYGQPNWPTQDVVPIITNFEGFFDQRRGLFIWLFVLPCLFSPERACMCSYECRQLFMLRNCQQYSIYSNKKASLRSGKKTNIPSHLPSPLRLVLREAGRMGVQGKLYCTSSKFAAQPGAWWPCCKYYYDSKLYRNVPCTLSGSVLSGPAWRDSVRTRQSWWAWNEVRFVWQ